MEGGKQSATSLRTMLDEFFNPNPSSGSKNQKQRDLEDPVDIYSHTSKFFKADKLTDSYANTIEIGERKIRPAGIDESELEQAVYGGKKVSRKDLDNKSDDDYDEEIESDDE